MRALMILAALAAGLALSSTSGAPDDEDAPPTTASEVVVSGDRPRDVTPPVDRVELHGESGSAIATACEIVSRADVERIVDEAAGGDLGPLQRTANDSLDLSFCEFRENEGAQEIFVRIGLDTATKAVRRYFNRISEARQLPNIFDPSEENRLKLVFGVGDDGTYGGAGAFWIPATLDLTSIKGGRIVKAHFYVPGVGDREAKQAAAELARLAYAGYAAAEESAR